MSATNTSAATTTLSTTRWSLGSLRLERLPVKDRQAFIRLADAHTQHLRCQDPGTLSFNRALEECRAAEAGVRALGWESVHPLMRGDDEPGWVKPNRPR